MSDSGQYDDEIFVTYFDKASARLLRLAQDLVGEDQAAEVMDSAAQRFREMIPTIGYQDNPKHPMASSLFATQANLALFLALRPCGVTAHQYGARMLKNMSGGKPNNAEAFGVPVEQIMKVFRDSAQDSQTQAAPAEFVYEFVEAQAQVDWGMNIQSCAVCHVFGKHDAMELVPYMCASDDVISERDDQGLVRTGSIGLGAHQCDFRFKYGGEGQSLHTQYPDRIRILG